MKKENKFKEGLKIDDSKRKIEELSSDKAWDYNKDLDKYTKPTNNDAIKEDEIVNLDKFYRMQKLDRINRAHDRMIEEDEIIEEERRAAEKREEVENRKRQQEYRRKLKKRNSILKGVFTTAGAMGLSTLIAMGIVDTVQDNINKPINFQQATQYGMNPQTDLGVSQKSVDKLNNINVRLEDSSNFKESDAYYTLTLINDAYEDVIIDKIVSATNTTGTVRLGSRYEDGDTVEYVKIEDKNTSNLYLKDSTVNSILHEKTIPKRMANAIGNYKETQSYMRKIQEQGSEIPLEDTIDKCQDLNEKLNEYAAVQISYDKDNNKFEAHVIRQSELDSIAEKNHLNNQNLNQSVQDASKSNNNKEIQNAVINNRENDNNIQNVNEYEEDYDR